MTAFRAGYGDLSFAFRDAKIRFAHRAFEVFMRLALFPFAFEKREAPRYFSAYPHIYAKLFLPCRDIARKSAQYG